MIDKPALALTVSSFITDGVASVTPDDLRRAFAAVSDVFDTGLDTVSEAIPDITGRATSQELQAVAQSIPSVDGLVTQTELNTVANAIPDVSIFARQDALDVVSASIPDVSGFATTTALQSVANSVPDVSGLATQDALGAVAASVPSIEGLATTDSVQAVQDSIPDISGLATSTALADEAAAIRGEIPSLNGLATTARVQEVEDAIPDVSGLATQTALNAVANSVPDISGLATTTELADEAAAIRSEFPSVEGLATTTQLQAVTDSIPNVSGYVTVENYNALLARIEALEAGAVVTPPAGGGVIVFPDWDTTRDPVLDANIIADLPVFTPQDYYDRAFAETMSMASETYTHVAVKDGRWSDPTVWDTRAIPGDNAKVKLDGFTVTYDADSTALIELICICGSEFIFERDTKTTLWVGTIMGNGRFVRGTAQEPIPNSGQVDADGLVVPQSEIVFWTPTAPGTSAKVGMMVSGQTRIAGAQKPTVLQSVGTIAAGATSVTLDASIKGIQVGDVVNIASTSYAGTSDTDAQYAGPLAVWMRQNGKQSLHTPSSFTSLGYMQSHDELRVLTAVDEATNTISWADPLAHSHDRITETHRNGMVFDIFPRVGVLTHSIRTRSADASDTPWTGDLTDLQKRGHCMFMHSDDVQVYFSEFKNLGRTDTNKTLASTQYVDPDDNSLNMEIIADGDPDNGGQVIIDPLNVSGRYPIHLHQNGAYASRKPCVVHGCSSWAPSDAPPIPGWAITQHGGRAHIDSNVVYNVRGAGIVSELGSETGQWIGNLVSWCRGDGYGATWLSPSEKIKGHNGSAGIAYESQARQILQQNNTATSSHFDWLALIQAPVVYGDYGDPQALIERVGDEHGFILRDPIVYGGAETGITTDFSDWGLLQDTYGHSQAQFPGFNDNVSYGCGSHFSVRHRRNNDRHDGTPMIAKRNHAINCKIAFDFPQYTWYYRFYDTLVYWDDAANPAKAVLHGTIQWDFFYRNIKCVNVQFFTDIGMKQNWNGPICADIDIDDGSTLGDFTTVEFTTDPANADLVDSSHPWRITDNGNGTWDVQMDEAVNYDSATQFPLTRNIPAGPFGMDSLPTYASGATIPSFTVDPASDLVANNSGNKLSIKGVIRDGIGNRFLGSYQTPSNNSTVSPGDYERVNYHLDADGIAERNGFWDDNGTYRARLHFMLEDRLEGRFLTEAEGAFVDVELQGLSQVIIDTYELAGPPAAPSTDFIPEVSPTAAIADTVAPVTIVDDGNPVVIGGEALAHEVRVDRVYGTLAVSGGVDSAQFEVATIMDAEGRKRVLRFVGNALADFDNPTDANADNFYDVELTFTDRFGNVGTQALTLEVLQAGAITEFETSFNGPAGQLETLDGFERVHTGGAGRLTIDGSGNLESTGGTFGNTFYAHPDIGRVDNIVFTLTRWSQPGFSIWLRNDPALDKIGISIDLGTDRTLSVKRRDNGVIKTVKFPASPNNSDIVVRIENGLFRTFYNGVEQTPDSDANFGAIDASHRIYLADWSGSRTNALQAYRVEYI